MDQSKAVTYWHTLSWKMGAAFTYWHTLRSHIGTRFLGKWGLRDQIPAIGHMRIWQSCTKSCKICPQHFIENVSCSCGHVILFDARRHLMHATRPQCSVTCCNPGLKMWKVCAKGCCSLNKCSSNLPLPLLAYRPRTRIKSVSSQSGLIAICTVLSQVILYLKSHR